MARKLGRPSDQRKAMLRNQVSDLLWNGKIETTLQKAKETRRIAEKVITLAVRSYEDTATATKEKTNLKGDKVAVSFNLDGAKKLNARRKIMEIVFDIKEQRVKGEKKAAFVARTKDVEHPLVEKIFNEYAPIYAAREKRLGQGGGYTRIFKLGVRRGDNAEMAILELIKDVPASK